LIREPQSSNGLIAQGKVLRSASALRVVIDYSAQLMPRWFSTIDDDGEVVFQRYPAYSGMTLPEVTSLDAFKVREAFDKIGSSRDDSRDALAFLQAVGSFWSLETVTLSQIREWQRFSNLVRRADFCALSDEYEKELKALQSTDRKGRKEQLVRLDKRLPENASAWKARRALGGLDGRFFQRSMHPGAEAMKVLNALPLEQKRRNLEDVKKLIESGEIDSGPMVAQLDREREIRNLAECFSTPGGLNHPPQIIAPFSTSPHSEPPYIHIFIDNALEAIAACTWCDRLSGIKWRKCKLPECHRIFEENAFGKEFCGDRHRGLFGDRERASRTWRKRETAAQQSTPAKTSQLSTRSARKAAQKTSTSRAKPKTRRGAK
jgi:hypothetical protein